MLRTYLLGKSSIVFLGAAATVVALLALLACGGSDGKQAGSPTAPAGMFSTLPTQESPVLGDQPPTIELNTPEPSPTPQPTPTSNPTYTPVPTPTPLPTPTPNPTGTPVPAPDPTPTQGPIPTPKSTGTPEPTATEYPTSTSYPTSTPYPTYTPLAPQPATKPTSAPAPTPTVEPIQAPIPRPTAQRVAVPVLQATSTPVPATIPTTTVPGPPSGLSAEADGETEIDLSWSRPSSDGGSRITGYRIEVSDSGSNWSVLEADTGSSRTSYTHRGLPGESTRHYRVSAINSAGTGPHSNTAHATTSAPCEGMTLEQAISKQRIIIVRCLVAEGADVNAKDSDGNPLLRLAIWHQISSIVGILVDAGADVDARDSDGYPLLDVAIRLAYSENVRILVEAGADVNARTADRYSLLTLAKLIGSAETIRILEDAGATEE